VSNSQLDSNNSSMLGLMNTEAEEAVLGGLLVDPDAFIFLTPRLKKDDFYSSRHGELYEIMEYLQEKRIGIDIVTIDNEVNIRKKADLLPVYFITRLISCTPTSIHTNHYADIVHNLSTSRKCIAALTKGVQDIYEQKLPVKETIEQIQLNLMDIEDGANKKKWQKLDSLNSKFYARIEEGRANGGIVGYKTGILQIDKDTGGLQKKSLDILAGRPKNGKTTMGLQIAMEGARRGENVALFSLEMSDEEVHNKCVAWLAGVDSRRTWDGILTNDQFELVLQATSAFDKYQFYVDDTAVSVADIRNKSIRLDAETGGLDLIIVDYLQLMQGGRRFGNRQEEVAYISRSLKTLARQLNCPVLALSQLNRAVEGRQKNKPILSDLRESGALEQDASRIMFIYYEDDDAKKAGLITVDLAANRFGPEGSYELTYTRPTGHFEGEDPNNWYKEEAALAIAPASNGNGDGQNGYRHKQTEAVF
jgi:replicative DNA helicase